MRKLLSLENKIVLYFYLAVNFITPIFLSYYHLSLTAGSVFGNSEFYESKLELFFIKFSIPIVVFNIILAILINKNVRYFKLGIITYITPITIYFLLLLLFVF